MDPKPYGPKRISRSRQITLPTELMKQRGLEIGDDIYLIDIGHQVLLIHESELRPLLRTLGGKKPERTK